MENLITFDQVKDWAEHQEDDGAPYCGACLAKMALTAGKEKKYYCPNEMCLNDRRYPIDPESWDE